MDVVAHGAISYLALGRNKGRRIMILSIIFGILPDLLSWTIYIIYSIFSGGLKFISSEGARHMYDVPSWVLVLYGISHSLLIFGVTLLILFLIIKKIPIYLWAWGLHILVDIPTHSKDFLPTPFLWPISNWYFPGISWATGWFFITYWILIIVCFIYLIFIKRKKILNNKETKRFIKPV